MSAGGWILLLEDEPAHAEAFVRAFQAEGRNDVVKVAGTLRKYRDLVAAGPPDIAVVDMVLSDGRGVDVLVTPPEAGLFPVVVMTSFGNERTAVEAMRAGALDYVVKSPTAFAEMPHTVARVLREWDLLREGQRTQAALRASEARFRGMAEQMADVLYTTDAQGIITFVSPSVRGVFGWVPEEMTGRHFHEFLVEDQGPKAVAAFSAAVESGVWTRDLALTMKRKDGSTFFGELTGAPIVTGAGRTGFLGVIRDVTERTKAAAERERLIGELRDALSKVKTLSGFIPICGSCKKIRDDKGYWNQIESYVSDHSDAEFSHGICPDCMVKLYPEFVADGDDSDQEQP
jgi:PAS domain S-box-containing protein